LSDYQKADSFHGARHSLGSQKTDYQKTDYQKADNQKSDCQKTDYQKADSFHGARHSLGSQKTDYQKADCQKADCQIRKKSGIKIYLFKTRYLLFSNKKNINLLMFRKLVIPLPTCNIKDN
jgi:hypothetical protein